jgi:hypothetical protein
MKATVACNSRKDHAWKFGVICGLIDFSSFLLIVNIEVQLRLALFQQQFGAGSVDGSQFCHSPLEYPHKSLKMNCSGLGSSEVNYLYIIFGLSPLYLVSSCRVIS